MVTSQAVSTTHTSAAGVTVYGFNFYVLEAAALKVRVNGVLVSNYTVQGLRQNAGGTITFAAAPAPGLSVEIRRDTARTQTKDFGYNDGFPSETIELQLDREICIVQELNARVTTNETDIAALQTQMTDALQNIVDLLNRVSNVEEWKDGLAATLATITQFYQGVQQALNDLQAMINQYGGVPGQFTTFIFRQSETKPATPTQGGVMIPPGWSDAPTATGVWWMSTGIVGFGNVPPASWTEPVKVTAEDGADGANGTYTDFKYAKNTSKTVAPALNQSVVAPAGWTDAPPALAGGEYMWMTKATKVAGTGEMAGPAPYWSTAVRISGEEGIKGDKGDKGDTATIVIGDTITGAAGSSASVQNLGNPNAAYLQFTIPRGNTGVAGNAATIAVGTVTTGAPGSAASVTNAGTANAAVLNFAIPRGNPGQDATSAITAQGTFVPVGVCSGIDWTGGTVYSGQAKYVVRGGWVYLTVRYSFGSVVKVSGGGSSGFYLDISGLPAAYRPDATLTNPNTYGRLMGMTWAENLPNYDNEMEITSYLEGSNLYFIRRDGANARAFMSADRIGDQSFFYANFSYPLLTS